MTSLTIVGLAAPANAAGFQSFMKIDGSRTISTVIITLTKLVNGGFVEYFKATLDTVQIERIELGDQNNALVEQLVLRPRNIRIEYRTQAKDDSYLPPVVSTITCN